MSKLHLVTFDVFNTLIRVKGSVGKLYSQAAAKYNLHFDEAVLNRCFRASFDDQTRVCPEYGAGQEVSTKAWWGEVVRKTFKAAGYNNNTTELGDRTLQALSDKLFRDFVKPSHWETFPESASVLQSLSKKGICLGVISNVDERLEKILEGLNLRSFFSFVICSRVVGVGKPSPRIFRMALSESGVTAEETLHIGDDADLDYWPAVSLGMNAFLLDRTGETTHLKIINGIKREHILKDLNQLLLYI